MAIPYSNIENPVYGSQFSNPLITLCLSIISIQNYKVVYTNSKAEIELNKFELGPKLAPHNKAIGGQPLDTNKDEYNEATRQSDGS